MAKSSVKYVLRQFSYAQDYPQYAAFWGEDTPPSRSSLPNIGLVVNDMSAVGFLANTDTDFAIITWWRANPDNKFGVSHSALKKLIMGLCHAAQIMGKQRIFIYTQNRGMIRLLESLNFINCDGHLVRRIF